MRTFASLQSRSASRSALQCVRLPAAFLAGIVLCADSNSAQSPSSPPASRFTPTAQQPHKSRAHKSAKKQEPAPAPVAQTPPPPPPPHWPVDDKHTPASVGWDAPGPLIHACNLTLV